MTSFAILAAMIAVFSAALYIHQWIVKRRQRHMTTDRTAAMIAVATKPPLATIITAIGLTVASGLAVVTFAFRSKHGHRVSISVDTPQRDPAAMNFHPAFPDASVPSSPVQRMKTIVFEDADRINPFTLEKCPDYKITYVTRRGDVQCLDEDEIAGDPRFDLNAKNRLNPVRWPMAPQMAPPAMQSFAPAAKKNTPPDERPLKDRYAEIIYFFALVLGVLGKYYWDHNECKQRGEHSEFHPNKIILALIVAALIYFLVQQGLEGEGDKFSTRGAMFAFTNGFTWQTLIKPGIFSTPKKPAEG